jgi:hypothetical protein
VPYGRPIQAESRSEAGGMGCSLRAGTTPAATVHTRKRVLFSAEERRSGSASTTKARGGMTAHEGRTQLVARPS